MNPQAEPVFKWSSPAPSGDGTFPEQWRVANATAMREVLSRAGYCDNMACVGYDPINVLHVGIRDN